MMTTHQFPFKVLFWFENDSKIITEIKRTDIQSATANKSLVYKWIVIKKEIRSSSVATELYDALSQNNDEGRISILTFQSMDSSGGNQTRSFAEGILRWDSEQANFNGEKMKPAEPGHLSMELIANFLSTS